MRSHPDFNASATTAFSPTVTGPARLSFAADYWLPPARCCCPASAPAISSIAHSSARTGALSAVWHRHSGAPAIAATHALGYLMNPMAPIRSLFRAVTSARPATGMSHRRKPSFWGTPCLGFLADSSNPHQIPVLPQAPCHRKTPSPPNAKHPTSTPTIDQNPIKTRPHAAA